MANKVVNGPLGVRLDASRTSAEGAEHQLGTTCIIAGSAAAAGNNVAVYVVCGQVLSTSAAVALTEAGGTASASAGGYIALSSGNQGDFIWVRSSGFLGDGVQT